MKEKVSKIVDDLYLEDKAINKQQHRALSGLLKVGETMRGKILNPKRNPLQKIEHWRETFGMPVRKTPVIPDRKEQELSVSLIEEELDELIYAINEEDLVEIADACGDLLFVVMQALNIHGLDVERVIDIVYNSNMSKMASTEEEAIESVENYHTKGVESFYEKRDGRYAILRTNDGKLLKAVSFKEPLWEKDYPELLNK